MLPADEIRASVDRLEPMAAALFDRLAAASTNTPGITRDTYGVGENHGHAIVAEYARGAGLDVGVDAALNTYMTLPGRDRAAPRVVIGSHLDSVPHGGNFDGAAGVLAGLVAVAALRDLGVQPACDVTVMGIRAEESVWFQVSYIGARSALGTLPPDALGAAKRIDTGRTLAEHIRASGGDPDAIRWGERMPQVRSLRAFLELHIEQAPSLVHAGRSIAVGDGVPGNFRFPDARIVGRYDHVGTPRRFRHDAALAAADFAVALDEIWRKREAASIPMAATLGRFHTDMQAHGLTTVPGEFFFSLDVRAYRPDVLEELEAAVRAAVTRIEEERGVRFDLGQRAVAAVGEMCPHLKEGLERGMAGLGLPASRLGSPASHDAAAFASVGVPTGMIFVRNENGSHNPAEAMELADFLDGAALLTWWLANELA